MSIVSIVAGGWSVRSVDVARLPGTIIGVNESALLIPRCDVLVSMDRLWTEARWSKGPPSAPNFAISKLRMASWIRRSAMQNIEQRERDWLTVFECNNESATFAFEAKRLNGPNSGHCALNLAHRMRPEIVYLFGFDMQRGPNGQPYWYPPYLWNPAGATSSRKYREWTAHFATAAEQFKKAGIRVLNCSNRSLLNCFDRIAHDEVLMEAA